MHFSFLQGTQKKIYWRMSSVLFFIMRTVKLQKFEMFPSFIVLKSHLCSFFVPDLPSWYQTSFMCLVIDIKSSLTHFNATFVNWMRFENSGREDFQQIIIKIDAFLCKDLLQFYCMASGSFYNFSIIFPHFWSYYYAVYIFVCVM